MVLNNPPRPPGDPEGGPCYRCVFPKPPPADSVTSCADGGILGPVVGTMGVLQALETIKVITTPHSGVSQSTSSASKAESPSLLIFSAYSNPQFRSIRLRARRANCAVCSGSATVTLNSITSGSTDYVFFCGSATLPSLLGPNERISPKEYRQKHPLSSNVDKSIMIDVRDKAQFGICNLENSINIPITNILASRSKPLNSDADEAELPSWVPAELGSSESTDPIYVVCRLGNDSQIAVQKLKELGLDHHGQRFIGDIQGGFRAWREQVDPEWPEY